MYSGFAAFPAAFPGGFPGFAIQNGIRDVPNFVGNFPGLGNPANFPNFGNMPNFGGIQQNPMAPKDSVLPHVGVPNGLHQNSGKFCSSYTFTNNHIVEFFIRMHFFLNQVPHQ